MKSTHIWAILFVGFLGWIAGCENQNTGMTTGPADVPADPPPEERYPAETATTIPPMEQSTSAAPGGQGTGAPPADTYQPAPPVDRQLPPEEPPRTARRSRSTPAPAENYEPARPRQGQTYTVKKGDTLQKISMKFYGTTKQWRKIQQANKSKIKDGDKITVGMKLTIPPR